MPPRCGRSMIVAETGPDTALRRGRRARARAGRTRLTPREWECARRRPLPHGVIVPGGAAERAAPTMVKPALPFRPRQRGVAGDRAQRPRRRSGGRPAIGVARVLRARRLRGWVAVRARVPSRSRCPTALRLFAQGAGLILRLPHGVLLARHARAPDRGVSQWPVLGGRRWRRHGGACRSPRRSEAADDRARLQRRQGRLVAKDAGRRPR